MKGHKEHRKEHAGGGETGGVDEAREDLETHPEARTNAKKIDAEAEERKRGGKAEEKHERDCKCKKCAGGRAMRKRGGHVREEKKHVGAVEGEHAKARADRKPRKAGGRATSDANPFTSARHGTPAKGRKMQMEME